MDPLTFDDDEMHLRVDRGVFEAFNLGALEHTFRVPLRWLGVSVHYKKPDKPGQLFVGVVRDPDAALYGADRLAFRFASSPAFRVPAADEPLFREYFSQVARLADRRVV